MAKLVVKPEKLTVEIAQKLIEKCPFGAIVPCGQSVEIDARCKMCRLCLRPEMGGAIQLVEQDEQVDLSEWDGILVFCQVKGQAPHPIALELLSKACDLAGEQVPIYAVCIGYNCQNAAQAVAMHGAKKVLMYDHADLEVFDPTSYTACLVDAIEHLKPSVVMVGATAEGRSLAPRAAARLNTGLTADCTALELEPGQALGQIRPAFGGNIMAHIITPKHRPQFCTVRYRVFDQKLPKGECGEVQSMSIPQNAFDMAFSLLEVTERPTEVDIADAERIVAVGRGFCDKAGMEYAQRLAHALGAQLAGTRPLIESGLLDPRRQIGLSGRTVKPKLLITLGISGAVQFVAGMGGSEYTVAINSDQNAPIMGAADLCIVGDLYEIVPVLLDKIGEGQQCLIK